MYKGKYQKVLEVSNTRKPSTAKPGKSGTVVFYSILGGFILIFCIGLAIAMNALNNWLVRFEASQPTAKCTAVFAELFANPDWKRIYELAPGDITAEDYARYMEQTVGEQTLSYIETSAGLSGDKKYIVRCGSEKIATFTLHNAAPGAEIPQWELGTVELFYQANLSVSIQASPDHTVLVNGEPLDESHVIRTVTTEAQKYLPQGVYGYRMNELVVHGLLTEPEVQILDAQGVPVEVEYDAQRRLYTAVPDSSEITEEHRLTLVTAAETYCKYMIGAATQTALRNCFDNRTEIYRTITESTIWRQSYTSYKLGEATLSDYYCYNEEYFSARVALTLKVTRKDGSIKEYPLDSTFFVKKAGEQWLVWEMTNANPQQLITQVRLEFISEDQVIRTGLVDAKINKLNLPVVTAPEGKTFAGWFTRNVGTDGNTVLELVFEPTEDGSLTLPADTVLEPMTLYALYQ